MSASLKEIHDKAEKESDKAYAVRGRACKAFYKAWGERAASAVLIELNKEWKAAYEVDRELWALKRKAFAEYEATWEEGVPHDPQDSSLYKCDDCGKIKLDVGTSPLRHDWCLVDRKMTQHWRLGPIASFFARIFGRVDGNWYWVD